MRRSVFFAAPLLFAATAVRAETPPQFEVTPSVGWRTGASLAESGSGTLYDVKASRSLGLAADVSLGRPGLFCEVAWTRQASQVSVDDAFGLGQSDVTFDSLLVGGQWVSAPREPIRPFLSALVGVTRIAAGGSTGTHFSASLSGGVKLMASDTFGVRLEARALAIFAGGSAAGLCSGAGCAVALSGWGTLQADFSGGVVLAF